MRAERGGCHTLGNGCHTGMIRAPVERGEPLQFWLPSSPGDPRACGAGPVENVCTVIALG